MKRGAEIVAESRGSSPAMAGKELFIGLDLGGTKIGTALTDSDGRIIAYDYRATCAAAGPAVVVERILDSARQVMAEAGVTLPQVAAAERPLKW